MEQRSECAQCILRDRRGFLREAVGAMIAAVALPVSVLSARERGTDGPRYPVPATMAYKSTATTR
jgi:hypothetical protein